MMDYTRHRGRWVTLALLPLLAPGANAAEGDQAQGKDARCPASFDYLVGEWTATYQGRVSDVKFEAPAGRCYLVEQITPRSDLDSHYFSLLAYDVKLKNWSFLSATPQGERLRFEKGRVHGEEATFEQADVQDGFKWRLSYVNSKNGSLREVTSRSKDGGKTWEVLDDTRWDKKK